MVTGTQSVFGAVGWFVLCFAAAGAGSIFVPGTWYQTLVKPPWTPPSWLFGPVWTVLYGMMAAAAWLVWKRYGVSGAGVPLAAFVAQLALNVAWSWLFFGLHRPGLAFAEIVLLWLAILATLVLFWNAERLAGVLLVPYLAWVSFAAVLNFALWRMNG